MHPRCRAPRRRRAFTLIELLVVMAVIAILAGILLPVIQRARTQAKMASTKNLLSQVMGALDRYSSDWGHYPPDFSSSSTYIKFENYTLASPTFSATMQVTSEALYYYLANANITRKHPYLELQAEVQWMDYNSNKLPELSDAWQRPFLYNRPQFAGVGATDFNKAGNPRHHATTYDLYSVGPNGRTNKDLPHPKEPGKLTEYDNLGLDANGYGDDSDDIASWK